jgi:putative intracellular protease/amidase
MRASTLLPLLAALPCAITVPSQPDWTNTTTLPVHYGLVVFDHFQALDVFGPMDILNSLFMLYSNNSTPHLSILSKTLEPVTTAMIKGGFGQEIVPTTTFKEYLAGRRCEDEGEKEEYQDHDGVAKKKRDSGQIPDIDVLIIPGGGGTRRNVTEEIAFVKALYPSVSPPPFLPFTHLTNTLQLKYIVSVCTGATILSRSGILDGRKATTNKRSWTWATSTGPNVTWVPTARWVEDGNIISSSGISAGIDAAYAFVSKVYGEEVAHYMSLSLEYNRVTDPHDDPYGLIWDVSGAT